MEESESELFLENIIQLYHSTGANRRVDCRNKPPRHKVRPTTKIYSNGLTDIFIGTVLQGFLAVGKK